MGTFIAIVAVALCVVLMPAIVLVLVKAGIALALPVLACYLLYCIIRACKDYFG
ncbi:MAG: hypothetical protein WC789_05825 [Lentisphaeria bacterium]|jgi:hypothetical protein